MISGRKNVGESASLPNSGRHSGAWSGGARAWRPVLGEGAVLPARTPALNLMGYYWEQIWAHGYVLFKPPGMQMAAVEFVGSWSPPIAVYFPHSADWVNSPRVATLEQALKYVEERLLRFDTADQWL